MRRDRHRPAGEPRLLDPADNRHLPIIAVRPADPRPISPPAAVIHILEDGHVAASDKHIQQRSVPASSTAGSMALATRPIMAGHDGSRAARHPAIPGARPRNRPLPRRSASRTCRRSTPVVWCPVRKTARKARIGAQQRRRHAPGHASSMELKPFVGYIDDTLKRAPGIRRSARPDRRITSAQERGGLGAGASYLSLPEPSVRTFTVESKRARSNGPSRRWTVPECARIPAWGIAPMCRSAALAVARSSA